MNEERKEKDSLPPQNIYASFQEFLPYSEIPNP